MDAHVFRRVSRVLADTLYRARLERIHEPVPGIVAFSLFASGKKQCLLFRAHRSAPALCITARSPFPNPAFPPAYIMRIRKYAEGRILGDARINWLQRQMAFLLPAKEGVPEKWLVLDCRTGASIKARLDPDFDTAPVWPELTDIAGSEPWERFQVLTPALRRALETLDERDASALLVDLEDGTGDLFWYGTGENPKTVSAWPLPFTPPVWEKTTLSEPDTILPLLEALYLPLLLVEAKTVAEAPEQKRDKSASRKRKKLLEKLEQERKRLDDMLLLGDDARLLQTHLWNLPATERLETVTLPRDPSNPEGETKTIALNSLLTITENMELFFKKSAKATRGLAMLEARTALLKEVPPTPMVSTTSGHPTAPHGQTARKPSRKKPLFSPSLIQEFVSSDGFTLWRGRNAEGNRDLLKLANPFDYWLHVEDGPSAHLIIRRDHAAQEVPERTLEEAGALVGLKSWRKDDPKAPIMIALAKHVQPIKGAKAGTVKVVEQQRGILASVDPALEERLKRAEIKP
ncbi:MAG: hypothetical protein DELT_00580 [Desulfovibrio sp.]